MAVVRVLFDAFAVRQGSTAVVAEGLLRGWAELAPTDELVVISSGHLPFSLPECARHEVVATWLPGPFGSLWQRTVGVRRAAKRFHADGVVSGVTASAFFGTECPRAVIVYDLRHEVRPRQFSLARRIARRLSYRWTFRFADALLCISQRTADDVIQRYPSAASKISVARLGSDHVDAWPAPSRDSGDAPHALAFGHFENKNVGAVLGAWAAFCASNDRWILRIVGMDADARRRVQEVVDRLGLERRVELMPWLDELAFAQCFVNSSLVVFPSDFEGFGLPVVEALRREIPVVISTDPALAEVSGGHAEVALDLTPASLAEAITRATVRTSEQRSAGRAWTDHLRWESMAGVTRDAIR